ncbi:MAG: hypothetical protein KDA63_08855, partial [Planctomycetales bacterium]|nr:hypothetical protein [Planctomycetales bacterium]
MNHRYFPTWPSRFSFFVMLGSGVLFAPAIVDAALITWVTDNSGSWHDAVNWSSDPSLPGVGDTVTINRGGANPVITFSSGSTTVDAITSTEVLSITG